MKAKYKVKQRGALLEGSIGKMETEAQRARSSWKVLNWGGNVQC